MPQDTTIYRAGSVQLSPEIDSISLQQQQQVLAVIQKERGHMNYAGSTEIFWVLLVLIVFFGIASRYGNSRARLFGMKKAEPDIDDDQLMPSTETSPLVYTGSSLHFSDKLLTQTLIKRFPFFNLLSETDKVKFLRRLKRFIAIKTFVIHDSSGYKEMPILISATAIQVGFGLDKYLLPNFDTFNIYPAEFLGTQPFIRFLIGNVSGNTINLSWQHFLEDFKHPDDGQNVGMHEIAHALYYQTFVVEENVDEDFRKTFDGFNLYGNKVFEAEKERESELFSSYAMKDFQEFWAESVEIFFEKPVELKSLYPDLYFVMSDLLNQDPAILVSKNIT